MEKQNAGGGRFEMLEQRQMLTGDVPFDTLPIDDLKEPVVEQKIDAMRNYFDGVLASEHDRFVDMAQRSGRDSLHLYNLQLAVDGILSMYEATGDRSILDKAILYTDSVMQSADVIEDGFFEADGYVDWEAVSGGRPRPERWGNMLHDFQYGSAMSRLARILHEDIRLQDDADLQAFGDEVTEFVDEQIVLKWLDVRGQRAWLEDFYDRGYWSDKSTHIITICHNLTAIQGDETSCSGIEVSLAEQFKNLLVLESDGAYTWSRYDAFPSSSNHHLAPDTNHENRTATMIARLGADKVVFDATDIARLSKTFTQRIWNGRTEWDEGTGLEQSPWFRNYVDGNDAPYRNYVFREGAEGMNGFVFDGWVRLGEFDAEVQAAGEALLSFVQSTGSSVNSVRLRNGSTYGKLALTGHLARNLRFAEFEPNEDEVQRELDAEQPFGPPPKAGDANSDGRVDFSDFLIVSNHFGDNSSAPWDVGDFSGDGSVSMTDFLILAASYSRN